MIGWAFDTFVGLSVVLLLVLAARRPVAHYFGAGWAYALWLLPLLRVAVSLLPMPAAELPNMLPPMTAMIPAAGDAAAPVPPSGGPGQWVPILLALWAGGAAAFILWQAVAYRLFVRRAARRSTPGDPSAYQGVALFESGDVDGPVAVGMLKRRIFVPDDFRLRYSAAERLLALRHERLHHRRGDLWWNCAAIGLLALCWPNPFAWIAYRAFRADQELSCDAAVAAGTSGPERHDYAQALVKSASRNGPVAACPLNRAGQLKRRLKMMKQHRTSRLRSLGGSAAVAGLLVAGLALSGTGNARMAPVTVSHGGATAPAQDDLISPVDKARLEAACPDSPRGSSSLNLEDDGSIRCGDGREVKDPEVRNVIVKTMKRARDKVAATRIDERQMAEIHAKVDEAHRKLAHLDIDVDMERAMAEAEASFEKARVQMRSIDLRGLERAELDAAMAEARAELAELDLKGIDREAMEKAMSEAKAKMVLIRANGPHLAEMREKMKGARLEMEAGRRAMDEARRDLDRRIMIIERRKPTE